MKRSRPKPERTADAYADAMRLLVRREHTRLELRHKLSRRGHASQAIEEALDRLASERLQSDARFVEIFIRHRIRQGYGPVRIGMELRERGVEQALADTGFDEAGVDWQDLARTVVVNRFGRTSPEDAREWAKRARYLQQRGFPADLVRRALER